MRLFHDGRVVLHGGDCREVLKAIPAGSIDSIVTDPPYGLGFMGKAWDAKDGAPFAVELWREALRVLKPGGHLAAFGGTRTYHRLAIAVEDAGFEIRDQLGWTYGTGFPKSHNLPGGLGTALKPAWEPIVLARKPLIGTVAANVLEHGTGALNIDGCRVEGKPKAFGNGTSRHGGQLGGGGESTGSRGEWSSSLGRWPANIVHDGSDEVVAAFPEAPSGGITHQPSRSGFSGNFSSGTHVQRRPDSGSAARFFYSAKATKADRINSKHPTVKPVSLMRWLTRLITPAGGTVLDPFAGTGTTGEACLREGFRAVLVEREPEYQADIARRFTPVLMSPLPVQEPVAIGA